MILNEYNDNIEPIKSVKERNAHQRKTQQKIKDKKSFVNFEKHFCFC